MRLKIFSILPAALLILFAANLATSRNLVILHTNDVHSHIDADKDGTVGILQRKALIDSIRNAEENVILVDAGDVVQGSLYFKYFRGEVEFPLMNMMDYDIQILGNHEFDNGIADIAKYYKELKATPLSANYDFSGTELDGIFSPYIIKEIDGRKIGFFGLNIDPASIISQKNIGEMKFKEIIPVANATAEYLKNEAGCDLVVAVTHIGAKKENEKTTDYDLARASKDIDIIIGGHSHTAIQPSETGQFPSIVENAEGRPVLVAQTGKYGANLGYIKIDLDKLDGSNGRDYDYQLIPVTARFPEEVLDRQMIEFIAPYRQRIDSINSRVIAYSARELANDTRTGGLSNFTADMAFDYGSHKADSLRNLNPDFPELDFAIMNVGGQRLKWLEGDITEGQVLTTYPFSNKLVIATLKGSDLIETMKIAAGKGGESISSQLLVVTDGENEPTVYLNSYEVDPDKEYTFATINYLFEGNDDLKPLANGTLLWEDDEEVATPILEYVKRKGNAGIAIDPDPRPRFIKKHIPSCEE